MDGKLEQFGDKIFLNMDEDKNVKSDLQHCILGVGTGMAKLVWAKLNNSVYICSAVCTPLPVPV